MIKLSLGMFLLKFWKNGKEKFSIFSIIEIIFSDIHVSIIPDKRVTKSFMNFLFPPSLHSTFESQIHVGYWKYLEDFMVVDATRYFKNTNHKYRILFWPNTKVSSSSRYDNNQFYEFAKYEDIFDNSFSPSVKASVIGMLFIIISSKYKSLSML